MYVWANDPEKMALWYDTGMATREHAKRFKSFSSFNARSTIFKVQMSLTDFKLSSCEKPYVNDSKENFLHKQTTIK